LRRATTPVEWNRRFAGRWAFRGETVLSLAGDRVNNDFREITNADNRASVYMANGYVALRQKCQMNSRTGWVFGSNIRGVQHHVWRRDLHMQPSQAVENGPTIGKASMFGR